MKCTLCNQKIWKKEAWLVPNEIMVKNHNGKKKTNLVIYVLNLLKGSEIWHEHCYIKKLGERYENERSTK